MGSRGEHLDWGYGWGLNTNPNPPSKPNTNPNPNPNPPLLPSPRAVCLMLLHAVAAHHSYQFEQFEHLQTPTSRPSALSLRQVQSDEKMLYFTPDQKTILETLERVQESASNIHMAVKLFNAVDDDGSGEVERGEFGTLVRSMGIDMSEERMDEVFASYDMDQGGSIGITEFLNFLKVCLFMLNFSMPVNGRSYRNDKS